MSGKGSADTRTPNHALRRANYDRIFGVPEVPRGRTLLDAPAPLACAKCGVAIPADATLRLCDRHVDELVDAILFEDEHVPEGAD